MRQTLLRFFPVTNLAILTILAPFFCITCPLILEEHTHAMFWCHNSPLKCQVYCPITDTVSQWQTQLHCPHEQSLSDAPFKK